MSNYVRGSRRPTADALGVGSKSKQLSTNVACYPSAHSDLLRPDGDYGRKERRSKGDFGLESTEDAYPRKSDISSASKDPSAEDIKSRKQQT